MYMCVVTEKEKYSRVRTSIVHSFLYLEKRATSWAFFSLYAKRNKGFF